MRTEAISILAALALHGALLAAARYMPVPRLVQDSDWRTLQTIDIELPASVPKEEPERPAPIARTETPPPSDPERPPEARVAARTVVPGPAPVPGPTSAPSAEQPPGPPSPAPAPRGTEWDKLPDDRGGVLGVPGVPGVGSPVWGIPGVIPGPATAAPAPTEAPKPRQVDRDIAGQVIRQAMNEKDKSIGLDLPAAGTVASVVADVVRGSDVPDDSKGSIEFRIGPNGQVLGYRVVSSNGGNADVWIRAASAAAGRIAGRALAMTGQYSRGAVITVDVVSKVQPPSGSKGGLSGAGASFDVSNIGAHATRNVRVSHRIVALR